MDFAERLPYLFHPELIYKLNSKRWLGECDLKSANDVLIDCEITCFNGSGGSKYWYYCGDDCQQCSEGIKKEIQRVQQILKERELPYVLKLTQSLSSVGTNIVTNEDERATLVDKITDYLKAYLPRITKENGHLQTTSLVLSDAIPGKTMALNFHVNRDGSIVFLGACHQLATGESGRQSTAIIYTDQEELEAKYRSMLAKIGKTLHGEGYYGPVGADIMENPKSGTLFTIDLNVRTPLSTLTLPLTPSSTSNGVLGTPGTAFLRRRSFSRKSVVGSCRKVSRMVMRASSLLRSKARVISEQRRQGPS